MQGVIADYPWYNSYPIKKIILKIYGLYIYLYLRIH